MPSAIVVGAGVFGASVAHRLAGAGWEVTLVDAETPGHERSTSGDESRLMRSGHGTDVWHTRSALRARTLWRELEAETGTSLYVEAGMAWFVRADDGWEADAERVMRDEGIPTERLEPGAAAELFPALGIADLAYVLHEPEGGAQAILIATGSEVQLAVAARERLAEEGVQARVVSAPSLEWFEQQDAEYRESVLPSSVTARVSVEAGIALTWRPYLGDRGRSVSIEHFGASADYKTLFREFGITTDAVVAAAKDSLAA